MGWDEVVFKTVYQSIRNLYLRKSTSDIENKRVYLVQIKERISILAKALTGENIEILPAENEGGFQDQRFFLPESYAAGPTAKENANFFIFRTIYLSAQKSLGFQWKAEEKRNREESLLKAKDSFPVVVRNILQNYKGSRRLVASVIYYEKKASRRRAKKPVTKDLDLSFLHGRWMSSGFLPSGESELLPNPSETNQKIETELEAPPKEGVQEIQVDEKSQQDYTLQHHFEKVNTAEEFEGNWRDFDGADELSDQEEALKELNLKDTVRSTEQVRSVWKTELTFGSGGLESKERISEEKSFRYDEWDYSKRQYRTDYCQVFAKNSYSTDREYAEKILLEYSTILNNLRTKFLYFANKRLEVTRQVDGEEIDLDLVVDSQIDILSGKTPSERIYISKPKQLRETSILILTDTSMSTDSYFDNKRILDVEKISLLLFGQVCSEFGDRFQIDHFSSRTRNHCDYFSVKSFDEPWERAKGKIGPIQASGYTRIGPAIRHALEQIRNESSSKRWILLLSDGKPNDYDRYEGKYGLEDVKQAIKECEKFEVQLFALAIDSKAKHYLPAMLGIGSFRILPHPSQLPEALMEFYMKLLR
ncbi:hypothetical protein CH373_05005 [Leptospira perolatii]|uniref:VWFA domain-containing protein n=1 Tax=Leptospira perolatii TaxID=2023191 RepID=A0A2M9ZQN7_9LEPT|nr:VWA domain-containing protein [Leptospira perolatii]PJZ70435.1 hypothetical protein CH360_05425 [Leptospira perolatii]PJZ74271.1 hypothetical protein CH373_05005 [Leptospira perolatii]